MQATVVRCQGDKGGTGDGISMNENENMCHGKSLAALLSFHQLCVGVSAGLRERCGLRGAALLCKQWKGQCVCASSGDQPVQT